MPGHRLQVEPGFWLIRSGLCSMGPNCPTMITRPAGCVPRRLLLMATAALAARQGEFAGPAVRPCEQAAAGWRQLTEVEGTLCIDVLAGQCSGLVEELGCDGLFTGNTSSAQAFVRDVCYSSCSGCPCFNAYDDHSVDEETDPATAPNDGQVDNSSEASESVAGAEALAQRSPCNALIVQGTYSCATHFCTSCDFAGLCDLSCEFCKENVEPTPVCTNPYDDFQGPGACDNQISSGQMTCSEDFCDTCTYAGFCVLSCGGCGTNSGNNGDAAGYGAEMPGTVVISPGAAEPEAAANNSTGQDEDIHTSEPETADSWCLWFGAGSKNSKYCAHPLLWVSILPMTGALCGLLLGCCLGCRTVRMRKRMPSDIVGIRDRDMDGDEIGGLEERPAGVSGQPRGNDGGTAAGETANLDGLRRSDKQLRTSGRRASFASSASSSSVFTQSSSRVKHSRTRKWVQQNTANPVAADSEWSGSDTGGRRGSSMVLRPEHAFDLETPPPSPPNELIDDDEGAMSAANDAGTPVSLQLTPEDFLAVIDEMTDDEVAQSCRELGLLATVKKPRHYQLRQALRSHYAGGNSAPAAAVSGPNSSLVRPQQQKQQHHQHHYQHPNHNEQHHHQRPEQHSALHRSRHQPRTLQQAQVRGGSGGSRRDPPRLQLDNERESQSQAQGQGHGHGRTRPGSQWIL